MKKGNVVSMEQTKKSLPMKALCWALALVLAICCNVPVSAWAAGQDTGDPKSASSGATQLSLGDDSDPYDDASMEDALRSAVPSVKATAKRAIWTRLWGNSHLDTMAKVAQAGWGKNSGGTVILATAGNFPDALSASGVAGLYNAPVLLTNKTSIPAQTKSELVRIKPARVIIVGGPGAIKTNVDAQVKAACGVSPVRCYGKAASDTAAKLATTYFGTRSPVAILATSTSFYDSLSAAPVAYAKHMPIFLADNARTISSNTLNSMKKCGIKQVIVVGGEKAITPAVVNKLRASGISLKERIGGATYYDTSKLIAEWGLKNGMNANKLGVATTYSFYDALTGAALCGKNNAVIVLADDKQCARATSFVKSNASAIAQGYVFGGALAVSYGVQDALIDALGAAKGSAAVLSAYASFLSKTITSQVSYKAEQFAVLDLDGDNVPELVTLSTQAGQMYYAQIFTYRNGKVVNVHWATTFNFFVNGVVSSYFNGGSYTTRKTTNYLMSGTKLVATTRKPSAERTVTYYDNTAANRNAVLS